MTSWRILGLSVLIRSNVITSEASLHLLCVFSFSAFVHFDQLATELGGEPADSGAEQILRESTLDPCTYFLHIGIQCVLPVFSSPCKLHTA